MTVFVYSIVAMLLGLIIGSFLNVIIHRGPAAWGLIEGEPGRHGSLAAPRSYCPACHQTLGVLNLIPVVSYLVQRGKCANCSAPISLRYPLIEIAGAGAALGAYLLHGLTIDAGLIALFLWTLIALAAIDAETGFLPDALTLPLIVLGLIANIGDRLVSLQSAFIGAAAGYLAFRGVSAAFRILRDKDGLGQGDAKLLAAIGAWGGWTALAPTVFVAALAALIGVALFAIAGRTVDHETQIPFGPALAAAGALVVSAGSAGVDLAVSLITGL